jgi:hypothetical protein
MAIYHLIAKTVSRGGSTKLRKIAAGIIETTPTPMNGPTAGCSNRMISKTVKNIEDCGAE